MLSPALMARTAACIDAVADAARARGVPLRIDETNSACQLANRNGLLKLALGYREAMRSRVSNVTPYGKLYL